MTAKLGIIKEVRKTSWCVSVKIKVSTAIHIVKLARTNYNIQPGDKIHWFEEKRHTFYWTSAKSDYIKAELHQWGHGPINDDR